MKDNLVNFEDFEDEEQKNSWKKNNYIDHIKSKIQNISEKTEKEYKIEFLLHRFSLENTKENLEILDLFCENINFNLESIWWNLKQNFASWNYEIIKYFFENFEINTLKQFENLSNLMICWNLEKIKMVVDRFWVKDETELVEVDEIICFSKIDLLEFFLNKDFINSISDLIRVEDILHLKRGTEVICFLIDHFKIYSFEEIYNLKTFQGKVISSFSKKEVSFLVNKLKISDWEDYKNFFWSKNVEYVFRVIKNWIFNVTLYLTNFIEKLQICSKKDFLDFFDKYNIGIIVEFNLFSFHQTIWNYALQSKENFEKIYKFISDKKVKWTVSSYMIRELQLSSSKINEIIDFYLTHKKAKTISKIFILIKDLEELDIDFNPDSINTFENYKDKDWNLIYRKLRFDFRRLLSKIDLSEKEKKKAFQSLQNYIKTKNDSWLEVFISKFAIPYYKKLFHQRIIDLAYYEAKESFCIETEDLDLQKIERPEFIEAFKMYKSAKFNKKDFAWILKNYLLGYFDNIEEQKQFDTWANRAWLNLNLSEEQQKIWLSKNKETFLYENNKKIIIEKELDPLNILMMWNRVDWSCFNYYSAGSNFSYTVANTVDANKWVFFIRDEKWSLLWRVCITIWINKKLVKYKIYKTWVWEKLELDSFLEKYLDILSEKMKIPISDEKVRTDMIECKEVYFDL